MCGISNDWTGILSMKIFTIKLVADEIISN
jgi:hypothetical protein